MLISEQIQGEMTKSLFMEKLRLACTNQVPGHFLVETYKVDMAHMKPLKGSGGLEMELKGWLFKFSSPFSNLIWAYFALFGFIWAK